MGHPISGALLIYQDATREPDHEIAASMGKEFAAAKKSKGAGKHGHGGHEPEAIVHATGTRPQAGHRNRAVAAGNQQRHRRNRA